MEKISAEGIPEEMLLALRGRERESKREGHFLYDEKAVQVVEVLDCDFTEMDKSAEMGRGAIAKAVLLDEMVGDYIRENPGAAVVDISCGIDTRFYRVDNGQIRWYNVDVQEKIEARKRLLGSHERVIDVPKAVSDESWMEEIEERGPILILAEGFAMYSARPEVQKLFRMAADRFENATVFMEITVPKVVKMAVDASTGQKKYSFGVKNGRKLQKMAEGFRAVRDVSLLEGLKKLYPNYKYYQFFPGMRSMSNKIVVLKQNAAAEK